MAIPAADAETEAYIGLNYALGYIQEQIRLDDQYFGNETFDIDMGELETTYLQALQDALWAD